MREERLAKVLGTLGLGSRREVERWIRQGRVSVAGQPAKLGDKVDQRALISVDGKPILLTGLTPLHRRVLVYHKPEGEMCTRRDPENRPTVFAHLPSLDRQRWMMIGRLDLNSLGLLLFTNDGELVYRLLHPSYEIEREYAVRVLGEVHVSTLDRLKKGVNLSDGVAAFTHIEERGGQGANHWYHVVLKEGRHREVRRLWESQGIQVSRLIRVRFGSVQLPLDLRRGQWKELETAEVRRLVSLVGLNS